MQRISIKKNVTMYKIMVLTATGDFAYQRKEDGMFVVPIGCLRN